MNRALDEAHEPPAPSSDGVGDALFNVVAAAMGNTAREPCDEPSADEFDPNLDEGAPMSMRLCCGEFRSCILCTSDNHIWMAEGKGWLV